MQSTIRERILVVMQDKITQMGSPDYSTVWHKVARVSVDRTNKLLDSAISVLDGTEVTLGRTSGMGIIDNNMTVLLEFWVKNTHGEQASTLMNAVIGDIKKLVLNNKHWSEPDGTCLALNTELISNSLDIDGLHDKFINGVVEIQVTYRHRFNDPTLLH